MSANAGSSDGDKSKSDDADKSKQEEKINRSELEEAVRRRQEALDAKRAADDRIKELEAQLAGKADDEAAKAGDIEKLRSTFAEREADYKKQISEAKLAHADTVLRSDVLSVLAEVSTDPEVAYLLVKDDFEVKADDKGVLRARPKSDTSSAKDFILKKLKSKSYLLKNDRKPGTGNEGSSDNGEGGSYTFEQLDNMSPGEYNAAVKKNPKLAKIYADGQRR